MKREHTASTSITHGLLQRLVPSSEMHLGVDAYIACGNGTSGGQERPPRIEFRHHRHFLLLEDVTGPYRFSVQAEIVP